MIRTHQQMPPLRPQRNEAFQNGGSPSPHRFRYQIDLIRMIWGYPSLGDCQRVSTEKYTGGYSWYQ